MMGRVQIWWRFWCLFSVHSAQPHSGQGLVLVLEPEVLSKARGTWHLISLILTSLVQFLSCTIYRLFFFSLCCLWLCPSLSDSFCTLEWLYHPSHYTSPCYFWVIPVSYVTFWTVNAAGSNIWLNSIFSFIFQLLICFSIIFICLGLFSSKFFHSIYPSLQFCITCFSLSLWCSCSLWIYSHWFQCSVISLSSKFTNLNAFLSCIYRHCWHW